MPVHWTIDHGQKLVTIVAEGAVTLDQLIAMVDGLRDAGAHGLRKLYDGARSTMHMTPEEVLTLGVHMRAEHRRSAMGPMAAILPAKDSELLAPLLGMVAASDRALRIFVAPGPALRWLLTQPAAAPPRASVD